MTRLYRVENVYHGTDPPAVLCSFETKSHGYVQASYNPDTGTRIPEHETADLYTLRREEVLDIIQILPIVYALIFHSGDIYRGSALSYIDEVEDVIMDGPDINRNV